MAKYKYDKDRGKALTNAIRATWKDFSQKSGVDLENLERLYDGSYRGDVHQMLSYKSEQFPTDPDKLKSACRDMFAGELILTTYLKQIGKIDKRLKHHRLDYDLVSKMKRVVEIMHNY